MEVRALSKEFGLFGWSKPSLSYMSYRFAYGEHITAEKQGIVNREEQFLFDRDFM